jgi:hypothetical protein
MDPRSANRRTTRQSSTGQRRRRRRPDPVVGTGHDRDMRSSIIQTLRNIGHLDTIARFRQEARRLVRTHGGTSGRHMRANVDSTMNTRRPPGRSSRAASGIHRYGVAPHRRAVFADHQIGQAAISGARSACRGSAGSAGRTRPAGAGRGQLPGRDSTQSVARRAGPATPRRTRCRSRAPRRPHRPGQPAGPAAGTAGCTRSPVRFGGCPPETRVPRKPGRQVLVPLAPGARHVTTCLACRALIVGTQPRLRTSDHPSAEPCEVQDRNRWIMRREASGM